MQNSFDLMQNSSVGTEPRIGVWHSVSLSGTVFALPVSNLMNLILNRLI